MNLFDRIRNSRSLADKSKKAPPVGELGTSGDFTMLYNKEEARKDTTTIAQYRRMLDNDGTAEAMYNLLTLPIKAASYHFEAPEGGAKELKLVEDNFLQAPHMGGMTFPFDLFIADILRSLVDGFRFYEKVVVVYDGQYRYRKLAPRDAETVFLKRDRNGGFAGAHQRVWVGSEYTDIEIPVERSFIFTYAKEREFLLGRSIFKSAFYHYDRKHKLYFLQQLAGEAGAVPGKKMTVPDAILNDEAKKNAAITALNNFGGIDSGILLGSGWTLEEFKNNPVDLQPAIDHHDKLMARSILAQFLVLAGSTTGSYSLGESDKENFLMALQGVMKQIEQHINYFIIPDLIDWNFGSKKYPTFKFEDISANTKKVMSDAFNEILKRPDLPGYVVEGISEQVGRELGIDTTAKPSDTTEPATAPKDDPAKANIKSTEKNNSEHDHVIQLSTGDLVRDLTEAEKRVNLSDLDRKMQTAEEDLTDVATEFFTSLKDTTAKNVTAMLSKGSIADLKDFTLGNFAPYRKALEEAMMTQYLLGKRSAADEMGSKMPQTPKQSRQYIKEQARAVADKQESDLTFAVKAEITKEARTAKLDDTRELGVADIIARLATVFSAFVSTSVSTGIAVSLAGSINLGRQDSFNASNDIDRMQYSAILDGRTTAMCKALDNSVVPYEVYLATPWKPPVHFNCRSIWVGIKKDDSFKPDFRPLPAAPGGHTAPQLSDDPEAFEAKQLEERAKRALAELDNAA